MKFDCVLLFGFSVGYCFVAVLSGPVILHLDILLVVVVLFGGILMFVFMGIF